MYDSFQSMDVDRDMECSCMSHRSMVFCAPLQVCCCKQCSHEETNACPADEVGDSVSLSLIDQESGIFVDDQVVDEEVQH